MVRERSVACPSQLEMSGRELGRLERFGGEANCSVWRERGHRESQDGVEDVAPVLQRNVRSKKLAFLSCAAVEESLLKIGRLRIFFFVLLRRCTKEEKVRDPAVGSTRWNVFDGWRRWWVVVVVVVQWQRWPEGADGVREVGTQDRVRDRSKEDWVASLEARPFTLFLQRPAVDGVVVIGARDGSPATCIIYFGREGWLSRQLSGW